MRIERKRTGIARTSFIVGFVTIAVLVPFGFIGAMDGWVASLSADRSPWQISRALAMASDVERSDRLPASGWTSVTLPNLFATREEPASVWYRLAVAVDRTPVDLWALYLQRPSGNYSVFVNDRFVGASAPMSEPLPLFVTPLLFKFPGSMLHSGNNRIEVRSVRDAPTSSFPKVAVGPDYALEPLFRANRFFFETSKQITIMCMLATSLLMASLFRLRSDDSAFGWFAVALMFWAAQIFISIEPRLPFGDVATRGELGVFIATLFVACSALFVHRFVGIQCPKRERWLGVWVTVCGCVLALQALSPDRGLRPLFTTLCLLPLSILGGYQTWLLVRAARKQIISSVGLLATIAWLLFAVGVRDTLVAVGLIDSGALYHPYTVTLVMFAVGLILLRRFMRAMQTAERARDELAIRVAEKTEELGRHLVRLKDLERERALSAERDRIMRDMHDGVGGKLVSALSIAVTRPDLRPLEEPLRACLDELSLIVDSIEPSNGNLTSALGAMRSCIARRLIETGVQLHWEMGAMPELDDFGPERVLQVIRIIQEAIANALKHARAKHITLRTYRTLDAAIVIEVADDGAGLAAEIGSGRGMQNMQRRAELLGARFSIDTSTRGTVLRLVLSSPRRVGAEDVTFVLSHE